MIKLDAPYRARPIRFLGLWNIDGWRMKVYGIAWDKPAPQQVLVDAAETIARQRLAQCPNEVEHYNVGFIGIHEGKTGNFIFIDWWANENELHHHVYTSTTEQPDELEYMTPSGLTACTWDLYVMCHEREAWVESVLKQYPHPDIEHYLETVLNRDV